MSKTKIVVAYHTAAPKQVDPIYLKYPDTFVLMLGDACHYVKGTDEFFDLLGRDDQGINISNLNKHINEFTVMYWAYKNQARLNYPEMLGVAHYRRYLDVDYANLDPSKIYVRRSKVDVLDHFYHFFVRETGYPVLSLILDNIINLYPFYKDDIELVLQECRFYDKNMFIMNPRYWEQYMEFMLPIERMMFHPSTIEQVKACRDGNQPAVDRYLLNRARGYFTEFASSLFFEHLRRLNYPLVITQPTEGSFNGN